ncbi:MAG: efflux RND transporter permease subunit [Xanthomonadaceae bacterium]|nr:efflux RND transporter permease subunit [Xanthomonadaceae bacterium]
MILSDISIRRPVFAAVISLMLVILGVMSFTRLSVREYPDIDPPIVSVEVPYRGASADVIETQVTQVIEDQIAGLEGIAKLTSRSEDEEANIRIEFNVGRDIDSAANDVRDRVSRVVDNLPPEAGVPEVQKADASTQSVMWLVLTSDTMSQLDLTDYAERVLVDQLSVVDGVARVRVGGQRRYAMRIWLDRNRMAAHRVTVGDIEAALRRENVQLPAGRLESSQREFSLRTLTGYATPEDFGRLAIGSGPDGYVVRLADVAEVEIGAQNTRNAARANTVPAVSIGIEQQSRANTVAVSEGVMAAIARIRPTLPDGIRLEVNFDRAAFINASITEVFKALAIALVLVLVVIYCFLGTLRATMIPAVVVPVSIIATFSVMAALGFSINVLLLLGLVLAIGLVVDDAIIVLENIYRRIEEGQTPLLAAIDGAREIGFAVIATTLVLISVFLPVSFIQGNIGRLFGEFGIALAAAVALSSLVALTLTPMMCSKLFTGAARRQWFARQVDRFFRWLSEAYGRMLRWTLAHNWVVLIAAAAVTALAYMMFAGLPKEYAPKEDRGVFYVIVSAPEGASFEYTDRYMRQVEEVLMQYVESGEARRVLTRVPAGWGGGGVNTARALVMLADWEIRERSAEELADEVRLQVQDFPGVRVRVATPQGLGVRGGDTPLEVVLGGGDYAEIAGWRDLLMARMDENPGLTGVESDYDERTPQIRVAIDRDRAATLGVSLANIGRTLETMLGSRIVTRYIDRGLEYNVLLQSREQDRATPSDLRNIYVRSDATGRMVPLSNLVTLTELAGPSELRRFDRLRAITVSAGLTPGYSLGEAIDWVYEFSRTELPPYARVSFDGEAREFVQSGGSLYWTFLLALVIVFLVLAAQFESFRHPLIIMTTVPLAVTGALVGLSLQGFSINVYSQIGIILLVGLSAKNGVLITEFANQLRDRGMDFTQAIVEGARVRLRPVLMTSLCTTFGAVPLLLATGAGAESRQPIGVVVVYGVAFSTLLTLFVIPTFYSLLARNTRPPQYVSRMIKELRAQVG